MKRILGLLLTLAFVAAFVAGFVAACGTTPGPTEPAATQTPWIVVVTATPGPQTVAETEPTQTPWVIVATPTPTRMAAATPTTEPMTSPAVTPTSPTETAEPTQTEAAPTAAAPAPTNTTSTSELKYPAPVLVDPPNNRPVSWNGELTLIWEPVGELAEDEYYHVHLERPPKTEAVDWWGDYVYTKDTELVLQSPFLAPFHYAAEHGHAVVYWWVRVVRKTGEDEAGKPLGVDLSAPSEKRTLILDPKPEGQ
jgi:hypothetical protein